MIDPQKSADYRALLKDVFGQQWPAQQDCPFMECDTGRCAPSEIELVNSSASACFYSLLFLAQAIGEQKLSVPLRLEVVSNRAQEVVAGDVLSCGKDDGVRTLQSDLAGISPH